MSEITWDKPSEQCLRMGSQSRPGGELFTIQPGDWVDVYSVAGGTGRRTKLVFPDRTVDSKFPCAFARASNGGETQIPSLPAHLRVSEDGTMLQKWHVVNRAWQAFDPNVMENYTPRQYSLSVDEMFTGRKIEILSRQSGL